MVRPILLSEYRACELTAPFHNAFAHPLGIVHFTLDVAVYREPLVYNLQVAREVLKQIYVAERLQLPSASAVQNAYSTLWSRASNPSYWTRDFLRNGDMLKVGIYGLEAYGVFKVCMPRSCPSALLLYSLSANVILTRVV